MPRQPRDKQGRFASKGGGGRGGGGGSRKRSGGGGGKKKFKPSTAAKEFIKYNKRGGKLTWKEFSQGRSASE
jgi:hypothetical protein